MRLEQPKSTVHRAVLPGLAAVGVLVLAACGTVRAGAFSQPSAGVRNSVAAPSSAGSGGLQDAGESAVCSSLSRLDRAVVTLTAGPASGPSRAALPGGVTITDAATVRNLAGAVCGLSTMPPGRMSCPLDTGGGYRIAFSEPGRAFPRVTVEASGCRTVTGAGPVRVADAAFFALLSSDLGGARPTSSSGMP